MIKNKLLEAINKKQMLEIYTDINHRDRFHVGYILSVKNNFVLEYNIGVHGEYDGLSVEKVSDIYRLECGTDYLDDLLILNKNYNLTTELYADNHEDILSYLLVTAQQNKLITMIWLSLEDEPIIGYISNIEGNDINVKLVADNGNYLGDEILLLDKVHRIVIDDCNCRDIDILHRYKN